ncbi:MAG: DUF1579 domain-containing protein [Sphingomonas sp.]|uniref:DUF1579 domain-containing protein n=1 Tax=Sphingomonas sp. TaxID=28214 RepID=UPI001840AF0D|nr:DUF1579 domain-containing protein [Sphingomonas sp.]MBA3666652.1 DUF1579 domain-containing protein [Sphingomonas sp.]
MIERDEQEFGGNIEVGKKARSELSAPAAGNFDFLFGRWSVQHRKLRERLAGCAEWFAFPGTLEVGPILGGLGNFDYNGLADPEGSYSAHSLRLYSSASREWSIWWLDSRDTSAGLGPAVVGRFEGLKITLFGEDMFRGKPIRVRTSYEPLGANDAQWTQAFWRDEESNWEVNWIMDFSRRPQ